MRPSPCAARIAGFSTPKAYPALAGRGPFDRVVPVAGLVGSANLTRAGLTTNQELVLTHKTVPAVEEVDDPEARVILRVPNAWGARYE